VSKRNLKPITERQVTFCHRYIELLNATKAYREAGYNCSTGDSVTAAASRLLKKPVVKAYIKKLQRERIERLQIRSDRVLANLSAMAFADMRGMVDENGRLRRLEDLPDDLAASVQSFKVTQRKGEDGLYEDVLEYKFIDKKGVNETLLKHLGELDENVNMNHSGAIEGSPLTDEVLSVMERIEKKIGA